jgi:hypothetical protein
MQHLVGHAAQQQGGKIGVAREPITIRPAPCSLATSKMRRAAEPYMVWRRSTRARSLQVLGVLLGELDRPSVPFEVALGGTPDRAGARSCGRRRSHLHRPWRSWRPARPPSRWAWIRQPRAGWCRNRRLTSVGGLVGGNLHWQAPTFQARWSAGRGRADKGPPHSQAVDGLRYRRYRGA